jgi:FKBP-type peptidyl-prolyl cis-trans isomerase FklB
MIKFLPIVLIFSLLIFSCSSEIENFQLKDRTDSVSYSIGLNIAQKLKNEGVTVINPKALEAGLYHALYNDSLVLIDKKIAKEIIIQFFLDVKKQKYQKNIVDANNFLDNNKSKNSVTTTNTGLQYIIDVEGNGKKPKLEDEVSVHYIGKFLNGEEFFNTYNTLPVSFYVKNSIKAWQEALPKMNSGAKWKLFVHPNLAYGTKGVDDIIQPNQLIIYEIELLSINSKK